MLARMVKTEMKKKKANVLDPKGISAFWQNVKEEIEKNSIFTTNFASFFNKFVNKKT